MGVLRTNNLLEQNRALATELAETKAALEDTERKRHEAAKEIARRDTAEALINAKLKRGDVLPLPIEWEGK